MRTFTEGDTIKRLLAVAILISALAVPSGATEQEMDLIILEGAHVYADDLPALEDAFPDIVFPEFGFLSTSAYKRYRPTWATFQKQLYLVGLQAVVNGKLVHNNEILAGYTFPLKVTAWSGTLIQIGRSYPFNPDSEVQMVKTYTSTIVIEKGLITDISSKTELKPEENIGEQPAAQIQPEGAPSD